MIGPFRGGRVLAVTGIPGQPDVYYFGAVAGGIWKTTNSGITWQPIFDTQCIASIGALATAPSNPQIIYAGSGEADMRSDVSFGDGIYRSDDGGNSWRSLGLADTRQIVRIIVDPHDPDLVLVAALAPGLVGGTRLGFGLGFGVGGGGGSPKTELRIRCKTVVLFQDFSTTHPDHRQRGMLNLQFVRSKYLLNFPDQRRCLSIAGHFLLTRSITARTPFF